MIRGHESWVSEHQAPARPTFCDKDQALEDARAEAEEAKWDLLTAGQDLANMQGEVDYWKKRAEAAEKGQLLRDTSEKRRGRSLDDPMMITKTLSRSPTGPAMVSVRIERICS